MSVDISLPDQVTPGNSFEIGTHTFEKEDIIRFATQWDPQVFHTDPEKAEESLFGKLCASGWHTISVWMQLQRKAIARRTREAREAGTPLAEFGPSPGMKHIKWLLPVFAGDTITYSDTIKAIRDSGSKPGWHIMNSEITATNQHSVPVMTFQSTVFVKIV